MSSVTARTNGPEVLVLRPVDLVPLQARMRRVHLQVERRGLDRLLLVTGQLREAVGEGVSDAELHQVSISTGSRSRRAIHCPKCGHASHIVSSPISCAASVPMTGFW